MHIKMETLFCVGTLDYKTFKGSYGIHVVRMDGEKGSLTHVSERNDGYNPSFLISNKTGTGIYTVSERLEDGALTFYHLNGEELLFKSALNLPGEGCVHAQMSPDQRFILVACWKTANVIVCSLHNHFVINSVSYVDGKKYEQRRSQYAEFRAASDKLCREYDLSVVEQPRKKEPARYARMREAIDQACEDASTAEDFHRALYQQGYIFGSDPNRKYATIRARDGGRAVRLYRLGEEYDLTAIDDRLRGNYLLYGSRLYELKNPPRQNTPKRYRPKDAYAGKGILQIFFEVFFGESQMHRLYLYYCYQLGILPKKQQPRISRPELERIWKDTEKILAEHAFVHDHKFPSLQAIVDYRKSLSQQMETLAAQRAEIVKQMRRKDAPPELADQRMILTCQIAKLRKEDKIAEGAIKRVQRTRESNRIDQENQYTNNKNRRRNRSRQR